MYEKEIKNIVKIIRQGGIILYPTEGVYGLGCDPFNETATKRLLKIKQRSSNKGLILIASNWNQVKKLININPNNYTTINECFIPTTWVFTATEYVPHWIVGQHKSVAIRVTTHQIAKNICNEFNGPIVSTSANISGDNPVTDIKMVNEDIMNYVDIIVDGFVGSLSKSTRICDFNTMKIIRS